MMATLGLAVLAVLVADKGAVKPPFDAKAKATAYLKENTNDPTKFSIVKISEPMNPRGFLVADELGKPAYFIEQSVGVAVKFREANVFGAIELNNDILLFDNHGNVVKKLPSSRVRPQKPGDKDPLMKSFLDQFP